MSAVTPTPPALRVLSVIPPMTQLNTPYPSTAYLTGFLRSRGVDAVQEDLALALVLRLLSPEGLRAIAAKVDALPPKKRSAAVQSFAEQQDRYLATIGKGATARSPTASWAATTCPRGPALHRWMCMSMTRAATRWAGPLAPWA